MSSFIGPQLLQRRPIGLSVGCVNSISLPRPNAQFRGLDRCSDFGLRVNAMLEKGALLLFIASFAVCSPSNPTKHPRYTLLLPDGSIGWFR
jgi:hypothetical protein